MLSDREIADLWSWAAAQDQGQETTQQHAFARAVERAAYERAAQWIEGSPVSCSGGTLLLSQSFIAANLRALGEQHD